MAQLLEYGKNKIHKDQLMLMMVMISCVTAILTLKNEQAILPTIILLVVISYSGLLLIQWLAKKNQDKRIIYLGYFWILKLSLTIFILYIGWTPQLNPSSSSWGYDPQRYYVQAMELVNNQWVSDFNLNYPGILYYYGFFFKFIGHNPVVPALVNSFTTLVGTLALVRAGYELMSVRTNSDWRLGLAMFFPDIIWYDVMTSRESLLMTLMTLISLSFGSLLIGNQTRSYSHILFVIMSIVGILAIRTSMIFALISVMGIMILFVKNYRVQNARNILNLVIGTLMIISLLIISPIISSTLGGYEFSIESQLSNRSAVLEMDNIQWSDNSIGKLLIPNNPFQSVIYIFPRLILYLVSPLPQIGFSTSGLIEGRWAEWQYLMGTVSAFLYVTMFPVVIASLIHSINDRRNNPSYLIFNISYWMLMISIVAGNLIIHDRYRLMSALLFCGCFWLGRRTCPTSLINKTSWNWYGILLSGVAFYVFYKVSL